ncbi:MAG: hypothetical protein QXD43_02515 [Candidatus Aenigmatarchaeota archaeon]
MKGLFHVHTKYSDGKYSLEELKNLFYGKYQYIFLTDHKEHMSIKKMNKMIKECGRLSEKNFLLIPGIEMKNKVGHKLIVGIALSKKNQLNIIAHPNKQLLKMVNELKNIDGIEVWNSYTDGIIPNHKTLRMLKKIRNNFKFNILAIGGLDLHNSKIVNIEIEIFTKKLNVKNLIKNIKKGNFRTISQYITLQPNGKIFYHQNKIILFIKNFLLMNILCFIRKIAEFLRKINFRPKFIIKIYHKLFGEK